MANNKTPDLADIEPSQAEAAPVIKLTRDELRAMMLEPDKTIQARIPLTLKGVTFEWQRPSIQEMQEAQNSGGERNFVTALLITHSYIEGTDEKLFSDEDYDKIVKMPFSGEYSKIVNTIVDALNLKVDDKVKN